MFRDLNKLIKIVELERYNIGRRTLKQWLSIIIVRPSACIECRARYCFTNSVRPSFCPWNADVFKRMNMSSNSFHHLL